VTTVAPALDGPARREAAEDHAYRHTGHPRAAVTGALWSFLNALVPAVAGMVVFTLASRALTATEFGWVALAAGIGSIASALSPAGLGEGIVQRSDLRRVHLDSVFWACMVSGLLLYGGLALAAGFAAAAMQEELLFSLILVLGSRILFDSAAVVPTALLVRTMAFRQLALRTSLAALLSGAVCLGLLWAGMGLWALALSQLATAAALSVGALVSARWLPRPSFSRTALTELWRFGFFASAVRALGIASVDQVLMGVLLGPAALGLYNFARRIFQLLSDLIAGALGTVSFSLLASLQADRKRRRDAFLFATFVSSAVSFPIFVGLAMVAGDVVPLLFGAHWVEAVPALQAFSMLGLITSVGVLQSSLIRSDGQIDMWFYYMLAKQALSVLYIALFHGWGITSLVWSIVISQYIMWVPAVHMVLGILGISLLAYLRHFLAPVLASLIMAAALHLLGDRLPVAGWERLAGLVAIGGLVYAGAMLVLAGGQVRKMARVLMRRERYETASAGASSEA
jgi:teichuronic acid exporter